MAVTNTKAWRPKMNRKTFSDYVVDANIARAKLGLPATAYYGTSKEAMKIIASRLQAQAREAAK